MPLDPAALDVAPVLAIVVALGLGGVVKGVTGMGLPLVAIPVLAGFVGVPHAIAIMTLPILFTNAWQIATLRRAAGGLAFLAPMLVAGAVGVGLGTFLLVSLDEAMLSLTLAAMLVAYVALRLVHPEFRVGARAARVAAAPVGLAAGVLQGATGVSAPIGVTFIHAMRFDRDTHVFAVSAMFGMFAVAQTAAIAYAGLLTGPRLVESAIALAPAAIAMGLGQRLARRFSRETFDRLILALLAVTAMKMVYDALA